MDANKTKHIKQNETKVYNCVFELNLLELVVVLRFPCNFFIQWKTTNGNKTTRTAGLVENVQGKVSFNQKLTLEVQMLHDDLKNTWIRKDSSINVYLVTKNKPDFNQLVGRINIDLSLICEGDLYKQPRVQALAYSSTSVHLKLSLSLKYSMQSKKLVSQINLLEFSERLYLVKQHDSLSKSKSMDYLKYSGNLVSPVYQVNNLVISKQKLPQAKPLHFPIRKLENFGHEVQESQTIQKCQFNMRMTLGGGQKNISKQDYDQMIQQQAKGMKKSNLMIIPDIKKNRLEEQDQFYTEHSKKTSQDDFIVDPLYNKVKATRMGRTNSQTKFKGSKISQQSDINILVDLQKNSTAMKKSLNSSQSFSLDKSKAQYQNQSQQNPYKAKSSKQQATTQSNFLNLAQEDTQYEYKRLMLQCQANKNRVTQLEIDISQLIKLLTDSRQKLQKAQHEKQEDKDRIRDLYRQKGQLLSINAQIISRYESQCKINSIHCQKLRNMSSQLSTVRRKSIHTTQDINITQQLTKATLKLQTLTDHSKKLQIQKSRLQQRLYKRDQIQLQNQIKIQQLQGQLEEYRSQRLGSVFRNNVSVLGVQSTIQYKQNDPSKWAGQKARMEYVNSLVQKMEIMEQENFKIKFRLSENQQRFLSFIQRDQKMSQGIAIIQKQSRQIIKQLIQKQKLLKQTVNQTQSWKNKYFSTAFNANVSSQLKMKAIQDKLKKKEQLICFCQNQINYLQQQNSKLQQQNKQMSQLHKKLLRQTLRYEGDLKVIKQQQNYKQSLSLSGQNTPRIPSSNLTNQEQHIVSCYRRAVQSYFLKKNIQQTINSFFVVEINDFRPKAFEQFQRSTLVISDLQIDNQSLYQQILLIKEQRQRVKQQYQSKIEQMQTKIDRYEQNQTILAVQSTITPNCKNNFLKSQQDKSERFSQSTRKKSLLNLNAESQSKRQVQKLKSIIYDKNKQMSDLIASHEKLKLQKQTQSMLIRSKTVATGSGKEINIEKQYNMQNQDSIEQHYVHDILDLQIQLNKQKKYKNQIMGELQLRKSLNRSQEVSQYIQHNNFDLFSIHKQLKQIITGRQSYITTEKTLYGLTLKINQLQEKSERIDEDYKLIYLVEQKSRSISRQLQKLKTVLFKMSVKDIQTFQYKTAIIFKPCQSSINQLLKAVQNMVSTFE